MGTSRHPAADRRGLAGSAPASTTVVDGRTILIAGETATGKSALALEAAEALSGEIVSVDAVAVYRGLDVGSAKPDAAARRRVAHHLLDLCEPWQGYTLGRFLADARGALARIHARGRPAILVGGTGLYARALVEGWRPPPPPSPALRAELRLRLRREGAAALWRELAMRDPARAAHLSPNDATRVVRALERALEGVPEGGADPDLALGPDLEAYVLRIDPAVLAGRVRRRAEAHFASGLLDETLAALRRGASPHDPGLRHIGYRAAAAWCVGRLGRREALERTIADTLALAKRQRTLWRRLEWAVPVSPAEALHRLLDR